MIVKGCRHDGVESLVKAESKSAGAERTVSIINETSSVESCDKQVRQ